MRKSSETSTNRTKKNEIIRHKIGKFTLRKRRFAQSSVGEREFVCGCKRIFRAFEVLCRHVSEVHGEKFVPGTISRIRIKTVLPENFPANAKPNIAGFYASFQSHISRIPILVCHLPENSSATLMSSFSNFMSLFDLPELTQLGNEIAYFDALNCSNTDFRNFGKTLNICRMTGFYLYTIKFEVSSEFFKEYTLFCALLLNYVNRSEREAVPEKNSAKDSAEEETAQTQIHEDKLERVEERRLLSDRGESFDMEIVVESINGFVSTDFVKWFEKFVPRGTQLQFLTMSVDGLRCAILMAKLLADWVFDVGLVGYRLEFN